MSSGTYIKVSWLRDDRGRSLYDVLRALDQRRIFLEVLAPDHCQPDDVAELANELEVGAVLRGCAVLAPLALSTFDGRPALELEHGPGAFLDTLLGAPMALGPFLDFAVSLVSGIVDVHGHGIIHDDLRPANLLVDSQTGTVQLCGLGLARRVASEPSRVHPLRLTQGALPYVSPEKTGHLNRAIDSRSDLYSCGVVLYQLLAGRLPFAADDALGWIHCHVARRPPAPADLVPSLSPTVSELLLRLLEKTPEARYQSALGLLRDLQRCQANFRATGHVAAFPLGEHDASDRFALPRRLHGRERERVLLLESFDRVASSAGSGLVLVGGPPGIGKSMLVQELQHPVAARSGRLVSGKFDQHRRDIPYAGVVEAIRQLVLDVLADRAYAPTRWRNLMNDATGASGAVICDLIPELRPVLAPSGEITPLPPEDAELRVRRLLGRVIRGFASSAQPLVIFLDDVQWADAASMKLLVDLLTSGESEHLLVVAAYRDNEVDCQHPFRRASQEIVASGIFVRELTLGPLSPEAVETLVAEVVRAPRDEAAPLAAAIGAKTAGSPFFIGHLLAELHRQNLLLFDVVAERWRWDLDRVRQAPCSDNVIDLIVTKLRDLPAQTQETVGFAACLGTAFTAHTLALILDREPSPALQAAVDADLLSSVGGESYRFPHDRVREAAYALVPDDERARLHLRIGRQLLSASGGSGRSSEAGIFDIVHHLHRAVSLLTRVEEREEVAGLDLLAGRRAQATGGHASALSYLEAGALLLAADGETRRYTLWFALELGRAESERLTGLFAQAEERLQRLAARAQGIVDQTAVVCAQAAAAVVTRQAVRGVELVLAHLQRFGIDWSPQPKESAIRDEYQRLRERLGDRPIEELRDLPPLSDTEGGAKLDSLLALRLLATMTDERLMYLAAARLAHLTVELGQSDAAPLAFVTVGQMLGPYFGDYQSGFRFARLGLELMDCRGQTRFRSDILFSAGAFVYPWTQPLTAALDLLRRAGEAALEVGESMWQVGSANQAITLRLLASGDSLDVLGREAEHLVASARKGKLDLVGDLVASRERLISSLRGLTPRFGRFDDAEFNEQDHEAHLGGNPSLVVIEGWYWIFKLTARYHEGDYAAALAAGARAKALLWTSAFAVERIEYHLYHGLALAAHHDGAALEERAQHRAALDEHTRALAARANDCPQTFTACAALLAAELARIDGAVEPAMYEYERALHAARDHGQAGILAVALEAVSRFYRARRIELAADMYLREARNAYVLWGAHGKARALEASHRTLLPRESRARDSTMTWRSEELDVLAIIKASQAISGALVREDLLELLLTIVLEQGGARRARLILIRDDTTDGALEVVAEKSVDDDAATRLQPAPRVPDSLLDYVKRTEAPIVLDDAQADAGRFANDPYFARARPRSVLCLPVRRQGAVIGLIYLENDLAPGVFTRDRLLALELLAAQAAVSLENAHLLGRERQAREQAEADRQRAVLLGEATAIMSSSPDHSGVAGAIRHLAVGGFADWAVVAAMDGATISPLACAHREVAREPLLRRLAELYPTRVAAALAPAPSTEQTAPLHLPSLSDEQLRERCADGRHLDLVRELGVRSILVLPLVARGQRVGVLSFGSGGPYGFPPGDIELATELGRTVAMSLDNARLTQLESKLRESQKMEAIGRLAGGVSHDFNNLLCVILSYVYLLKESLHEGDERRKQFDEIQRAAERATALTRQLLAFSRQQVTRPVLLDLNGEVQGMASLLAPLLGEKIELAFAMSPSAATVRVDRGQLGQVLMNLAVNARDAMPSGGRITVRTRNVDLAEGQARAHPGVPPGRYVMLSVTDGGVGIDQQTQARIFEPFFTTKEAGKGTGLGLATVFGIVQESGGHIALESQPGRGATFTIYLPRGETRPDVATEAPANLSAMSGTETVLLVEDDEQVRLAVRTALLRMGYSVVEASGPGDALLICEQQQTRIDLLVTDVQMPRLTGVELARRLRAGQPGLRVLLMSGYADPALVRDALREPGTAFLEKPITPDTLARAVRELLDAEHRIHGDRKDGAGLLP